MNSKDCHWRYYVRIEFSVPNQLTKYQTEKYEKKITELVEGVLGGRMEILAWVPRPCLPGDHLDDIKIDQDPERREQRRREAFETALRKSKVEGPTQ